ncbi:MAG: hypothetical protein KDC05_14190 [Bacteroidales bacterium]|nr:hypothetical protein [Bacteroidales bacterium]
MKKITLVSAFVLLTVSYTASSAETCKWAGEIKPGLKNNWSVSLQFGYASYFGDLSIYDEDPVNKLRFESKLSSGLRIHKTLGSAFGVAAQLYYGGFKGGESNRFHFETDLFEYSVRGQVDFIKLLSSKHSPATGLYGFAGIGQFIFKTTGHQMMEGENLTRIQNTGVPEFVYFTGGGIDYRLTRHFKINAELSIRQAQNDNLDNIIKGGDLDYYSLFTVGFSWTINNVLSPFTPNNQAYKDLGLTRRR